MLRLMRIQDIMSSPVYAVVPDAGLFEAAALMMERGFTTLPVVAADGALLGIVTEADLVRVRFTPGTHGTPTPEDGAFAGVVPHTVRQIMHATPATVGPGTEVADAAAAMVDSDQRSLPVVDAAGRVVGMVSWRDLLGRLPTRT